MMATMASRFSSMSNVSDAFLLGKMDINCERKNKVNFNKFKDGSRFKCDFKRKV
jgi:hypothetical protein